MTGNFHCKNTIYLSHGFTHRLLHDTLHRVYSHLTSGCTHTLFQVYSDFDSSLFTVYSMFTLTFPFVLLTPYSRCTLTLLHVLLALYSRLTHTSVISHTFLRIFLTLFSGLLKLTLWVHSCITQAFFLAFSRYYTHCSPGVLTLCSRCTHNFFQVLLTLYSGFTHTLCLLSSYFSMVFTHALRWL